MKKNKSATKNIYKANRQNLVNKISNAMNLKYGSYFSAANYDKNSLKKDIDKLINTQYYSKDPREVFTPIESNILDIVKRKNPNLQVKIKKPRILPEIKYTTDKYQEADKGEKEEKNLTKKLQTPNKKNQLSKNNNIKEQKLKNKNRSASSNQLKVNKLNVINNNNNIEKNKNEEKNIINNNNNNINKKPEEYGRKNILVEQLKNRIKYDPILKYLEEEKKLYEKEQQEKKQRKI